MKNSLSIPKEVRELIRQNKYDFPTSGIAPGFLQTNLVILPEALAFDFLLFCSRNPAPCPLIEVIEAGKFEARETAPGSDLRTDLPRYRIFKNGHFVEEQTNILSYWQDDFVSFLIGCSFTFESELLRSGIPLRHIEENKNVSMYITNRDTKPAGIFRGKEVVSMRPVHRSNLVKAVQITSRFPSVHGAPVHIGDPAAIGIKDLASPDYGDAVTFKSGEIPVFWACGVTPQQVALTSKPNLMISHAPGHMFITDLSDLSKAVF